MQVETYNKTQIKEVLTDAREIAVMPSLKAGAEAFAAAAGLFYMLQEEYENRKHVHFVHSGEIPKGCESLITAENIRSNLTHRDLFVSIDYSNTPAAKVSYITDKGILTLKLGPVDKGFDKKRVNTNITGFNYDLVLIVGASDIEDLGSIYHNLKEEIYESKIINIDNKKENKRYGIVNIIDTKSNNLSALVFKKASEFGFIPNDKAAKCLLTGMSYRNS